LVYTGFWFIQGSGLTVYTFFRSEVPYSEGQITFNILSPEPVTRPAYNKFYETPELHDFVEASLVRVKLEDHYFTNHFRHEY